MEEKDKIKKLETSEHFEGTADEFELKGKDGGEMGDFVQFVFLPNDEFNNLSLEEKGRIVLDTLRKQLLDYCEKIGWWPDPNRPAYRIDRHDDGAYLLKSYLKKGVGKNAKLASEIEAAVGTIGINEK